MNSSGRVIIWFHCHYFATFRSGSSNLFSLFIMVREPNLRVRDSNYELGVHLYFKSCFDHVGHIIIPVIINLYIKTHFCLTKCIHFKIYYFIQVILSFINTLHHYLKSHFRLILKSIKLILYSSLWPLPIWYLLYID